ncbi:MAG TPA: argininosuccinate lyase [Chloroflexi bacterium]|jgi:argininosuccinate lyase|nr:argininosuccinate lyase [Chloroflexota bacterium]
MMARLWGGRFSGVTDELMWAFNASIDIDRRMAAADVRGSIAYARALARAGVLTEAERDELVNGLEQVAAEFEAGTFAYAPSDEDIHTAVERRLGELIGPVAGKLHTGRSRNDQVATDVRLFLIKALAEMDGALSTVQAAMVRRAEEHLDVIMPGYTHLQPAQPVRFSHWLMSYFWMLQRDRERLADALRRVRRCPLGAGALAGNTYGIDREALARDLGFDGITENSIDAVSDRDMIVEVLSWGALVGTHLSRLAEDLIIYSSVEYGFLRLDERYTTGSSIMPQKRNPDSMELVRGKTGRLVGNLTRMLVVTKGIPSSYDKDLQEDKEPLFDTLDTLAMVLPIVGGVIDTLELRPEAMRAALDDAMLATDLADYLARRGMPFRQAHHLVGQAVAAAESRGLTLRTLSYEVYREISAEFDEDMVAVLDFEASVEARDVAGGTARAAVIEQIEKARALL